MTCFVQEALEFLKIKNYLIFKGINFCSRKGNTVYFFGFWNQR